MLGDISYHKAIRQSEGKHSIHFTSVHFTSVVPCKSAFTAPNLCWACALAFPVTFLTGGHVVQIAFGQISPSASCTRDLGTRLGKNGGVLSMRLQVSLDSLFARPSSAPILGGKKGDFRDWTNHKIYHFKTDRQ